MSTIELTYLQGIIKEFNHQHVELHLCNFDGKWIKFELRNECRSSNYSMNIEKVDPHEFRVELLQKLTDFFDR